MSLVCGSYLELIFLCTFWLNNLNKISLSFSCCEQVKSFYLYRQILGRNCKISKKYHLEVKILAKHNYATTTEVQVNMINIAY